MKHTVLIAEDRRPLREGMIQALMHEGFAAVGAANGQEALEYFEGGGSASLIILDLQMPVMDGWSFRQAQATRPRIAEIPTIILSGLDVSQGEALGTPTATLQKPIDLQQFIATVRTVCAGLEDDAPDGRRG
jgi:CheY-like chemotaxis protein